LNHDQAAGHPEWHSMIFLILFMWMPILYVPMGDSNLLPNPLLVIVFPSHPVLCNLYNWNKASNNLRIRQSELEYLWLELFYVAGEYYILCWTSPSAVEVLIHSDNLNMIFCVRELHLYQWSETLNLIYTDNMDV
jgi:hypothetical protein